jgi:hypothetical protein
LWSGLLVLWPALWLDLTELIPKDVVWQEEKQSGLIDSILRNYYIPPIIFGA